MIRYRILPLAAIATLAAALLVASSSSAQLGQTVVVESTEEAFADLSSVVEAELRLGDDFNVRIGPVNEDSGSKSGPKRSFPFENGVPTAFSLKFHPDTVEDEEPDRYELLVGGDTMVEIFRGTESEDVDLVIVRAESNVAGASLVMDNIQLVVPPVSGIGGFTFDTV
ncbi:MAG: hypothetical protein IH848_10100, partial [Acidobacteria bacterium]|nr:hypothetical protein [Acidobacteriota bacterium]